MKETIKKIIIRQFFNLGKLGPLFFNDFILEKIGLKSSFHKVIKSKSPLVSTKTDLAKSQKKKGTVLFIRMRFVPRAYSIELALAQSLRSKGWESKFIACNSILKICNGWDIRHEENNTSDIVCQTCQYNNKKFSEVIDFPMLFIEDYLTKKEIIELEDKIEIKNVNELKDLTLDGVNLKDEIYLSLAKFLFKGQLSHDDLEYANRFAKTSLLLVIVLKKMIQNEKPDIAIMNCGHIFWFGIAYKILSQMNIKTLTYDETNIAVTHLTWTFDSRNPCVDYNWNNEWTKFKDVTLTNENEKEILSLIEERQKYFLYQKTNDTISFSKEYDLSLYKYKFSLFTNVLWDATVVGKNSVYDEGLIDWVKHSISIIERYPEACLIIRVHPAEKEVYGMRSRERVIEELRKWKTNFAENIIFIESESKMNSYEIVENTDIVLIYATNLGLEAVFKNKMVVLTGPAHYINKGFTQDPSTPEEFEGLLKKIIEEDFYAYPDTALATKYAYLAFIKTQVKLSIFMDKHPHLVSDLKISSFSDFIHDEQISKLTDWIINEQGYFLND
jgi:hypothetical protein